MVSRYSSTEVREITLSERLFASFVSRSSCTPSANRVLYSSWRYDGKQGDQQVLNEQEQPPVAVIRFNYTGIVVAIRGGYQRISN